MNRLKAIAFLVAAILYFLFPVDAIPDLTPAIGFLDDLLVVLVGVAMFLRQWRKPKGLPPPSKTEGPGEEP